MECRFLHEQMNLKIKTENLKAQEIDISLFIPQIWNIQSISQFVRRTDWNLKSRD